MRRLAKCSHHWLDKETAEELADQAVQHEHETGGEDEGESASVVPRIEQAADSVKKLCLRPPSWATSSAAPSTPPLGSRHSRPTTSVYVNNIGDGQANIEAGAEELLAATKHAERLCLSAADAFGREARNVERALDLVKQSR